MNDTTNDAVPADESNTSRGDQLSLRTRILVVILGNAAGILIAFVIFQLVDFHPAFWFWPAAVVITHLPRFLIFVARSQKAVAPND